MLEDERDRAQSDDAFELTDATTETGSVAATGSSTLANPDLASSAAGTGSDNTAGSDS